MAKVNKEYQWRMEGMVFAHKIVKEGGLESLEKEIRMRNFLKVDIWAKKGDVEKLEETLSRNLYNSFVSTMLFTIHDEFGFAKKRLWKLKDAFDEKVSGIFDLNWYGEHYVRFEDYAKFLISEYDFDFDVNRIAALQDLQDEQDPRYKRLDPAITLKELREQGFNDAAEWLEKKIS